MSSFWSQWKHDMKYETEIGYLEVIYDADSVYATEIRINCQTDGIRWHHYCWDNKNIKLPISW